MTSVCVIAAEGELAVGQPPPTLVRCYQMQIHANRVQRRALAELLEGSRLVYNAALGDWAGAYRWASTLSGCLGLARFDRKAVPAISDGCGA